MAVSRVVVVGGGVIGLSTACQLARMRVGGYFRPAAGNRILLGVETPDRDEYRVEALDFRMTELLTPLEVRDGAVTRYPNQAQAFCVLDADRA